MITITLPTETGSYGFVTTIEVSNVRRCSSESHKLRYVHSIRGTPRDITVKERKIDNVKIEIVPLLFMDGVIMDNHYLLWRGMLCHSFTSRFAQQQI